MTANGMGSQGFIDNLMAEQISKMSYEVFRATLVAHIQLDATKLIGNCSSMQKNNGLKP